MKKEKIIAIVAIVLVVTAIIDLSNLNIREEEDTAEFLVEVEETEEDIIAYEERIIDYTQAGSEDEDFKEIQLDLYDKQVIGNYADKAQSLIEVFFEEKSKLTSLSYEKQCSDLIANFKKTREVELLYDNKNILEFAGTNMEDMNICELATKENEYFARIMQSESKVGCINSYEREVNSYNFMVSEQINIYPDLDDKRVLIIRFTEANSLTEHYYFELAVDF